MCIYDLHRKKLVARYLRRQFFLNCFLKIFKSNFCAKHFVIYSDIGWFDGIPLMTKAEESGIYCFNFHIIGIFLFDFPGQRTEIGSPFPGRTVGIYFYFNHGPPPPYLLRSPG